MKQNQLNRLSQLASVVSEEEFVKEANLENDMAKRIMLSVIPGLADPAANRYYGGFPDYKALKLAVQGADRIIKYAAISCVEELVYYGDALEETDEEEYEYIDELKVARAKKESLTAAYNSGNYEAALKGSVECFNDERLWRRGFGGLAWAKIASTALTLQQLRKRQIALETNRPGKTPQELREIDEQDIQIMKEIVVYMNVFDGLAHNNGSIYEKMVNWEQADIDPDSSAWARSVKTDGRLARIKKMMDSKELENPIDVYKHIEQNLQESGDHLPYKDWMSKARRHPDYATHNKREQDIKKELEAVSKRKTVIKYIDYIKRLVPFFEAIKARLNTSRQVDFSRQEINHIVTESSEINHYCAEVHKAFKEVSRNEEADKIRSLQVDLFRIVDDLSDFLTEEDYIESVNAANKILPMLHKFIDIASAF